MYCRYNRAVSKTAKEIRSHLSQDDVMMTPLVCEVIWFAGIACWSVIRYPFERKAKKFSVKKSLFGRREVKHPRCCFRRLGCDPSGIHCDRFSEIA